MGWSVRDTSVSGTLCPICAAGHRFSMPMYGLRLGHLCQACARNRTGYSQDHARALAVKRGGQCLSDSYGNSQEKLHWCCEAGHTWFASLDNVLRGHWCCACRILSIKPSQQDLGQKSIPAKVGSIILGGLYEIAFGVIRLLTAGHYAPYIPVNADPPNRWTIHINAHKVPHPIEPTAIQATNAGAACCNVGAIVQ